MSVTGPYIGFYKRDDQFVSRLVIYKVNSYTNQVTWIFNPALLEVNDVRVTPLEYKLVWFLATRRNRIVSKEELLAKVWGYSVKTETRTVDYFIGRIRKRFGYDCLKTIRSAGVIFTPMWKVLDPGITPTGDFDY